MIKQVRIFKEYLLGEKFNKGLVFGLNQRKNKNFYLTENLIRIVRDQTVLHIGFLDHKPLISKRINNNKWMHNLIIENSKSCYGIDIDLDLINWLKSKYKIKNIFYNNILEDNLIEEINKIEFDVIIIPDVLEHIFDLNFFLRRLRELFPQKKIRILLSVPNMFSLDNIYNLMRAKEVINSDHYYWFSPYTISRILLKNNFEINDILFLQREKLAKKNFFKKTIIKILPRFRDSIFIEVNGE